MVMPLVNIIEHSYVSVTNDRGLMIDITIGNYIALIDDISVILGILLKIKAVVKMAS